MQLKIGENTERKRNSEMSDRLGHFVERETKEERVRRLREEDKKREIPMDELCMHRNGFRCKCVERKENCGSQLQIAPSLLLHICVYSLRDVISAALIDLISFYLCSFDGKKRLHQICVFRRYLWNTNCIKEMRLQTRLTNSKKKIISLYIYGLILINNIKVLVKLMNYN